MIKSATAHRRASVLVFLFLGAVYLVTFGGHPYTGDGLEMLKTAESLALHGDLALSVDADGRAWGYAGADGRRYSPYAIGLSLLEAPPYAIAHAAATAIGLAPQARDNAAFAAAVGVNVAVTAGTGALLCVFILSFGFSRRAAITTSILYGVGTMAWVYSKHDFAEPLIALSLLATAHFLLRAGRERGAGVLLVAGICNGVGFVTKYQMILYTPVLLGALVMNERRRGTDLRGILARASWFLLPGLPFGLANLWVNHARFGTWLETGYGNQGPIFAGLGFAPAALFGLLLSPGKGLIWYSPVLLAVPFAWRAFHRSRPDVSSLCAALSATTFLIFAPLWWWHGDWAWGPRYLLVTLPELLVPLSVWFQERELATTAATERRTRGRILAALVVLSVAVNLLGVSFNFVYYLIELRQMQKVHDDWNFIPNLSPIRFHAHLAAAGVEEALGLDAPDFTYAAWCDGVLRQQKISMATFPPSGREPDYFFFRRRESAAARVALTLAGLAIAGSAIFFGARLRRSMEPGGS